MGFLRAEWSSVDVFGRILFETFIMDAADRKSGVTVTKWRKQIGDEIWFDFVVGIDKTDVVARDVF